MATLNDILLEILPRGELAPVPQPLRNMSTTEIERLLYISASPLHGLMALPLRRQEATEEACRSMIQSVSTMCDDLGMSAKEKSTMVPALKELDQLSLF